MVTATPVAHRPPSPRRPPDGSPTGVRSPDHAPVRVVAEPEAFGHWVQAAPFRAHVLHLAASTGLPLRVLAELAGASPRATVRLVTGRAGRPLTRIDPLLARRLFALTPAAVRRARDTAVDPGVAAEALSTLVDHGWTLGEVGARLRVSLGLLDAVRTGRRGLVSRLVEAQLVAAARTVPPAAERPGQPTAPRAAVA